MNPEWDFRVQHTFVSKNFGFIFMLASSLLRFFFSHSHCCYWLKTFAVLYVPVHYNNIIREKANGSVFGVFIFKKLIFEHTQSARTMYVRQAQFLTERSTIFFLMCFNVLCVSNLRITKKKERRRRTAYFIIMGCGCFCVCVSVSVCITKLF